MRPEMPPRTYPVKDNGTIARLQSDFSAKYKRNRDAGVVAFFFGEYKPFQGFPKEQWDKLFAVGFELEPHSQQAVIERISRPLQNLAEEYKIPAIFAGIGDLPPHITLHVGIFKDMDETQITAIKNWLLSDKSHLNLLSNIFKGLTFHLDTLVIAPNSYIGVSKFDDEQGAPYRARMVIEKMMQKAVGHLDHPGGTFGPPYRYDDILHISVSRLVHQASPEALLQFARAAYDQVGSVLVKEPVAVTVAAVHNELASDGIIRMNPRLLCR